MRITRYVQHPNTEPTPITFEKTDNTLTFENGQTFSVTPLSENQLLIQNTQTQQQFIAYTLQTESGVEVFVNGQIIKGQVFNKLPKVNNSKQAGTFQDKIVAPMPGKVLRILVAEGETIEAKQPLVLMESMKMELTLSSPTPAKVTTIKASVEQKVALGECLITLSEV